DTFLLLTAFVENSVEQTRAALDAAVAAGVKHVVKLSAAGASKDAPARLVRNHGLGEQSVRDSGLGWTIVRPTFFMDNFVNFQGESLRSQGVFYGAAEDGKIAYVSATDVGRVIAAALSSPGAHQSQVYEVTGAEAFSEAEAARQLSAVLERPVRYENVGTEAFKTSLIDSGMSPFHVEGLVFLEDVKAKGWASGTTDVVKLVTGEAPESFDGFIRRNRDALQSASL
ncbi:MAG: NmrA family NAD(P)-binding protein, partial [Myxococcota bacterium]